MKSSSSSESFCRSGVTMEDVSGDGEVPVEKERLTILQMVGEIEEDMSLIRLVGRGHNKNVCIQLLAWKSR